MLWREVGIAFGLVEQFPPRAHPIFLRPIAALIAQCNKAARGESCVTHHQHQLLQRHEACFLTRADPERETAVWFQHHICVANDLPAPVDELLCAAFPRGDEIVRQIVNRKRPAPAA